jgi:hypothetical protein
MTQYKNSTNNTEHSKYKYTYYRNTHTYTQPQLQSKLKPPQLVITHTYYLMHRFEEDVQRFDFDIGQKLWAVFKKSKWGKVRDGLSQSQNSLSLLLEYYKIWGGGGLYRWDIWHACRKLQISY